MINRARWTASVAALALAGAGGAALVAGFASAQEAPESLLPPGFDDPAPAPTPPPVAQPTAAPAGPVAPVPAPEGGTVQPIPSAPGALPSVPQLSQEELSGLPSLEELEELSTDQLDDLLGLKPQYDIPPAARRSLAQVGVLSQAEGGMQSGALANQPESLVRAILAGTRGPVVSRWGHILLRRTLASRLAAPDGMNPVEFAALRAGVLNSMGEYSVARGLVQDVDTGDWDTAMTSQALTAYIAMSDLVGACPAVRLQGGARENAQWKMMQAICNAYAGEGALAASQLNAAQSEEIAPEIDLTLAQRYAGAAGRGRGGVTVSWEGVKELSPWRYAIANAVGETLPEGLLDEAIAGRGGVYYQYAAAAAPMVPLAERAGFAEFAAARGVVSARALVDLYSQIYSDNAIGGAAADRSARLREAYVGPDAATRITAMRGLWGEGDTGFAGRVLTAYAAARISPSEANAEDAGDLIASMLTAGLDRDAASWGSVVEEGSLGWALVAIANPDGGQVASADVSSFASDDESEEARKTAFLVAGLAGLGRMPAGDASGYDVDLTRQTRWTRMIDRAAEVGNPAMVSLLAGLGMQGESWSQMTPLHLYHITSALRRVGLEAEARMIAAEAVARG
ncbi:hypothetical protein [uncultured Erythrobacter sp.]|uniref:hypothetical protein n=1 Tax=uncultured Erythrobacter sp. TaxID=263913 RepID=UPI002611904F|nr:hypothetical protein [uncultured Erythrobacter sp.]